LVTMRAGKDFPEPIITLPTAVPFPTNARSCAMILTALKASFSISNKMFGEDFRRAVSFLGKFLKISQIV
jgi:hypothetical protein